MFDIAPSEFMLVAFVALVVIGPKDLPKAMRVVGFWVGKARGVARQFRQGFDSMVREAELEEMEKRWAAENERIMREHPADAPPEMEPTGALPAPAQGSVASPPLPPAPPALPAGSAEAAVAAGEGSSPSPNLPQHDAGAGQIAGGARG